MRDFCPYCGSSEHVLYTDNQQYRDQPEKATPFCSCSRCRTIYPVPRLDFSKIWEYLTGISLEKCRIIQPLFYTVYANLFLNREIWPDRFDRMIIKVKNGDKVNKSVKDSV